MTFTAFVAGGVLFRAADIETAWRMLSAMVGLGGAMVPDHLAVDWDLRLINHGYISLSFILTWFGATWTLTGTMWTVMALAIALLVPDTMEIVNYREGDAQSNWRRSTGVLAWRPSPMTLGLTVVLFGVVFAMIGRVSEFLYYQF
jgi:hypothetical protein